MKARVAAAGAVGFVLGWAVCLAEGLYGSKFGCRAAAKLAEQYGPAPADDWYREYDEITPDAGDGINVHRIEMSELRAQS